MSGIGYRNKYDARQHRKHDEPSFVHDKGAKAGFEQNTLFQEVLTNHHSSPIDPKLQ